MKWFKSYFLFGNLVLQQKTNFKDKEGHYVDSLRKEKLKLLFQTVAETETNFEEKLTASTGGVSRKSLRKSSLFL